jgi:hypothetical protein
MKPRDEQITQLRAEGASYRIIADKFGISSERVAQILRAIEHANERKKSWDAHLRNRTRNCLWNALLELRKDLTETQAAHLVAQHSELFYLEQPNLGRGTLREIKAWLAKFNHTLPIH